MPDCYEFDFVGGSNNAYYFTTADTIVYEVKFEPSGYLFDHSLDLTVDAFEMIIAVADNPVGDRIPADSLTHNTILVIFHDFFNSHEKVIIFICDTSDRRQKARARKFTAWYYLSNGPRRDIFKCDRTIYEGEKEYALVSMLLMNQHPQFEEVLKAFMSIGTENK